MRSSVRIVLIKLECACYNDDLAKGKVEWGVLDSHFRGNGD
jgi:hypothetical protein